MLPLKLRIAVLFVVIALAGAPHALAAFGGGSHGFACGDRPEFRRDNAFHSGSFGHSGVFLTFRGNHCLVTNLISTAARLVFALLSPI